ncbi:unnamed protein product [Phytophthora fragariaefolia]|uniref:Unnamed protein product n=1 Tax=Phytophthora fragariaefolia TaxID=1490495 RepID=A0A9W6YGK5_9STRA|nr:unnamed protein product [Phytophthora fragariaefolia]
MELPKKFHTKRPNQGRMKRIKERLGGGHTIRLNDLLELRYCADGSVWCLISRKNFDKLVQLGRDVVATTLEKPVLGKPVGGHEMEARDRQLEQLACGHSEHDDGHFEIEEDACSGLDEEWIRACIELLIEAAQENGFPVELVDELRRIESKNDIWRLVVHDDPLAYKLRLKENAKPFRCKARQYAPLQTNFLREFRIGHWWSSAGSTKIPVVGGMCRATSSKAEIPRVPSSS